MVASFVLSCVAGAEDFNRGRQEGSNSQEPMGAYGIFCMFTILICFLVGLYAIACFIRFILCVNQGEVFTWDNVSLLRIVGWCSVIVPIVLAAVMTPETANLVEDWGSCISKLSAASWVASQATSLNIETNNHNFNLISMLHPIILWAIHLALTTIIGIVTSIIKCL